MAERLQRLWAPWRMAYVSGMPSAGCFLCQKPLQGEARDGENLILHRSRHSFVIINLFPYNSGHLMVAPYEHSGDLVGLAPEVGADLWALTSRAVAALGAEYRPDGFNIGLNLGLAAGAGQADHLHIHVVPRWAGDTNYMTITANTKVLPETLEETYRRLRPHFT